MDQAIDLDYVVSTVQYRFAVCTVYSARLIEVSRSFFRTKMKMESDILHSLSSGFFTK